MILLEYGDYECPYCGQAETVIRELLASFGDEVGYVWRHLPLNDVHPRAQVAAEVAEAAGAQGRFWEMHDSLFGDQGHLDDPHLWERAKALGLDLERFEAERRSDAVAERVERDFRTGIAAGVMKTPTLFHL